MEDYDLRLGYFPKKTYLTNELEQRLEGKYVKIVVFDNFLKTDYLEFNYLIIDLTNNFFMDEESINLIKKVKCKTLVLAPYRIQKIYFERFNNQLNRLLELSSNLEIILIPEIVGKGVFFNSNYLSHNLIKKSFLSERITVSSENLNLISLRKISTEIIREIFSFGMVAKKLLFIGFKGSEKEFLNKYVKISEDNILMKDTKLEFEKIIPDIIRKINFSLRPSILNMIKEFRIKEIENIDTKVQKQEHKNERPKTKKIFNKIIQFFVIIFFIYLIPAVLLIMSIGSFFIFSKLLLNKPLTANNFLSYSHFLTNSLSQFNLGSSFYVETSNLLLKVEEIAKNSLELVDDSKGLINSMTGDDVYNPSNYTDRISANLDKIYIDTNFLQSDIEEQKGILSKEINFFLDKYQIDISDFKNKIINFKKIVSRSSELLGVTEPKKYLILFQNNMELRPTGGFLGSFALVSFDKGRMSELVVNDIYSADGQLKGHIEPPMPIKKYLGEASWFMRDSNWDPDFQVSVDKIKWFLEKEIDQKVDGVIAIDLFFIKDLLEITGPINLVDFNKTIDSYNLYETTQSEVEGDFFAGSIKKESFLTSLSKELIREIENLSEDKHTAFFKKLYKNLEQRHIQIYFNDLNSNLAINDLSYSGKIDTKTNCGFRCFEDNYSLIDANLGVNKSNLFINRTQELSLNVSSNLINHELFVTYKNNAGQQAGTSGTYKNYARLILPKEADIKGVRLYYVDGSYVDLAYDIEEFEARKDLGFYFEVFPETTNKIQIVWNITTDMLIQGGEYKLKIRKQAGTEADELTVNIYTQDLILTGKDTSSYNTDLSKDFKLKLFVKPT